MTTTGFAASGTREAAVPSRCSRSAAGASLLLGAVLLGSLPAMDATAPYLAILGLAAALVAIAAGAVLWRRATLVARTVTAVAAGAVVFAQVLHALLGLPGVGEVDRLAALEYAALLAVAGTVLTLLAADALGRKPEQAPDRPYAL